MKAIVFEGVGRLTCKDVPEPKCGPDEILFKVLKASICNSSDYHIYEGSTNWDVAKQVPHIFGHEQCGRIEEVGKNVEGFSVGDRIGFSCTVGAFAEYNTVNPKETMGMAKLPDEISDEEGSLMEMLGGTLVQTIHPAGIKPGEKVLIIGQGPMGLVMTQLVKIYGASTVIVTDLNDNRLALAKELGADLVINASKLSVEEMAEEIDGAVGEVDLAITAIDTDNSAGKSCLKLAVKTLREYSNLTGLSSLAKVIREDAYEEFAPGVYEKSVKMARSLEQVYSLDPEETFKIWCGLFSNAVDWIREGRLNLKSLITHRVGLEEVEETLKFCKFHPAEAIKAVVKTT